MKINIKLSKIKIKISGESHSSNILLKVNGFKKNITYNPILLEEFIQRRKPKNIYETKRLETDLITIRKGIKNYKFTTGTIKVNIKNDYTSLNKYQIFNYHPRPGHADFARIKKYGSVTKEGTDVFSGRLTIPYVICGAFAKMHLNEIEVISDIVQIGNETDKSKFDSLLKNVKNDNDSISGIIKVVIKNVPPGLGDPKTYLADELISRLLFKIPGVKAVSYGNDFSNLAHLGSSYNDKIIDENGTTSTNNCGGITGGLTNGNDIVIYIFFRPASSIMQSQQTYNFKNNKIDQLNIKGSHDSFYINRARVVCESMILLALYDLINMK